jgi:hypothetical protein
MSMSHHDAMIGDIIPPNLHGIPPNLHGGEVLQTIRPARIP